MNEGCRNEGGMGCRPNSTQRETETATEGKQIQRGRAKQDQAGKEGRWWGYSLGKKGTNDARRATLDLLPLLPLRQSDSTLLDLPLLEISTDGSSGVSENSSELVRVVQDLELFESSNWDSSNEDRGNRCSSGETSEERSEDKSIG